MCAIAVAMVVDYVIMMVAGSFGWQVPTKVFFGSGCVLENREELKALDQYYQGHRSLLAKQLGVSRSTLWRYFKKMESDRP